MAIEQQLPSLYTCQRPFIPDPRPRQNYKVYVAEGFGKTEPSTHVVAIPKLVAEEGQQAKNELDCINL